MEKIIFDELDTTFGINNDYFNELFDNEYEDKIYIVTGDIGLWDGVRKNVHHPNFFHSLKSAILEANSGFDGYITVSEGKYGKLLLDISHHDGSNHLEIKELTKLGEELYNNYASVQKVINRKGATKNVKFIKNYR